MRYNVWTADPAEARRLVTSLVADKIAFRVSAEPDDSPRGFCNWTIKWEEGADRGYWFKEDLACTVTTAAVEIAAERQRQVTGEGYGQEHDDAHDRQQLASAAAYYACPKGDDLDPKHYSPRDLEEIRIFVASIWPWSPHGYPPKKHARRRELVIAGALVIAEIERLDRASIRQEAKDKGLDVPKAE